MSSNFKKKKCILIDISKKKMPTAKKRLIRNISFSNDFELYPKVTEVQHENLVITKSIGKNNGTELQ